MFALKIKTAETASGKATLCITQGGVYASLENGFATWIDNIVTYQIVKDGE